MVIMVIPLVELIPKIKDNNSFWNTIPTPVDKNFIGRHGATGHCRRILWVDNFDIAVVVLTRLRDFNGSSMLLGNAALMWLSCTRSRYKREDIKRED